VPTSQPAQQRPPHHDFRALRLRAAHAHGPGAEPEQEEAAERGKRIEHPRREDAGAHQRHRRQRRPHQVARQVAEDEGRAGPPPLRRADAEQGQNRRPRCQHDDGARNGRRHQERGCRARVARSIMVKREPFIPEDFARAVVDLHAAAGRRWLAALPVLIEDCSERWSIAVGQGLGPLSYHYVAAATLADGSPAVLKAGPPTADLAREIAALRCFDGRGAVRLLAANGERGLLLLERLTPGTPLTEIIDAEGDDAATDAAATVMLGLSRAPPPGQDFPLVEAWAGDIPSLRRRLGDGPLPSRLLDQAEDLFAGLIATMAEPVLLHGDLHHGNILRAERAAWLAIDPKGVVGEPAYEAGAVLRSPLPQPGPILARRLDLLAERLRLDRQRLRDWAIAQAVLSACWSVEDHGRGWEPAIACADLLAALR